MKDALHPPFPYFGGKWRAAGRIWEALGDPSGYVEPFAGSAAVLLVLDPKTGAMIHDPHPSGAGVTEVDEVELILALDGGEQHG